MKITAVRKDSSGVIKEYKLDDNSVVDASMAVSMVKDGLIENCNVFNTKAGTQAIRSNNDGDPSNNLDNLPTF